MARLLAVLIFLWAALPVQAGFLLDEARAAFDAHDIEGMEAHLAEAHRGSQSGAVTWDDVRRPYVAFSVTDPRMEAFIAEWLTAYPESPYAHTARAWFLYNRAWIIRGTNTYRWIPPSVADLAMSTFAQARDEAWIAYRAAPDLIAASDATLRLAMVIPPPIPIEDLLADIMEVTPSRGSLMRASVSMQPKWGGRLERMLAQCALYAARIEDVENYSTEVCNADQVFHVQLRGDVQKTAFKVLLKTNHPRIHYGYIQMPWTDTYMTPRWHAEFVKFLKTEGNRSLQLAADFAYLEKTPEAEAMLETVVQNAFAWAHAEFEYDPFNSEVLSIFVDEEITRSQKQGTLFDRALLDRLYRPYLINFPSDSEVWLRLADPDAVGSSNPLTPQRDLYMQNAIALTNQSPTTLTRYLESKFMNYHNQVEVWQRSGMPPASGETDEEIDVNHICPMIRAARLYYAQCGVDGGTGVCGTFYITQPDRFVPIIADAEERGVCKFERSAELYELFYTPHRPDWMKQDTVTMPGEWGN